MDRLAVLSSDGREQHIIDLEPYYPLHSLFLNALIADREGGVYLLLDPAGIVHFDADLRPEFRPLGPESSVYENFVIGWDGVLYTYDPNDDILRNWGTGHWAAAYGGAENWIEGVGDTGTVTPSARVDFLGADIQGRLYFRAYEPDRDWIIRMAGDGGDRTTAVVPDEYPDSYIVGPEGSFYGISYDLHDPDLSVRPEIVKCSLDE